MTNTTGLMISHNPWKWRTFLLRASPGTVANEVIVTCDRRVVLVFLISWISPLCSLKTPCPLPITVTNIMNPNLVNHHTYLILIDELSLRIIIHLLPSTTIPKPPQDLRRLVRLISLGFIHNLIVFFFKLSLLFEDIHPAFQVSRNYWYSLYWKLSRDITRTLLWLLMFKSSWQVLINRQL